MDAPPLPTEPYESQYQGLGGWLILVAIGLFWTPLRIGYALYTIYMPLFASPDWKMVSDPDSPVYQPHLKELIIGEVIGNSCTVLFAVVVLVLFFTKKRFFPAVMIVYLASNAILVWADLYLSKQIPLIAQQAADPSTMQEITRVTVGCAIWIPYMLVSKRVKATFTR